MTRTNSSGILKHLISARRPDVIIIKKKQRSCKIVDFACLADQIVELKGSEKNDKFLDLTKELKKTVEHERDVYTNYNWCFWYSQQRINKGTGGLGNKRTRGDNQNYYIIEIGQNTEKNP